MAEPFFWEKKGKFPPPKKILWQGFEWWGKEIKGKGALKAKSQHFSPGKRVDGERQPHRVCADSWEPNWASSSKTGKVGEDTENKPLRAWRVCKN